MLLSFEIDLFIFSKTPQIRILTKYLYAFNKKLHLLQVYSIGHVFFERFDYKKCFNAMQLFKASAADLDPNVVVSPFDNRVGQACERVFDCKYKGSVNSYAQVNFLLLKYAFFVLVSLLILRINMIKI